jgi:hypothetical protein
MLEDYVWSSIMSFQNAKTFTSKRQGVLKKDLDDFFKYLVLLSVSSNSVFICLNSRSSNRNFIDNLHIFNMFEVPEELNEFSTTVKLKTALELIQHQLECRS